MRQVYGALVLGCSTLISADPAAAYPIDCAIFLCLAGGFPPSFECSAAKAEMIRRITPFPIEPPLQLWNCPMRASSQRPATSSERLYKISYRLRNGANETSVWPFSHPLTSADAGPVLPLPGTPGDMAGLGGARLYPAQATDDMPNGTADMDISDPTYDFARSIRVWHIRARQSYGSVDDSCNRSLRIEFGDYGVQGDFRWRRTRAVEALDRLPPSFVGVEGYGDDACPTVSLRTVFMDWRDFEGNYDSEQVNY